MPTGDLSFRTVSVWPQRGDWLARYPQLAPELNAFFDDHENFERVKSALLDDSAKNAALELPDAADRYAVEAEIARLLEDLCDWEADERRPLASACSWN